MKKDCKQCKNNFEITADELRFYEKFDAGPQDICFDCGQKQRLSFRNERFLYNRKCDGTRENIVSIYAPDSPFKVYKSEYWYGDKWDALKYGREFDFNKTFFEQFGELQKDVPRIALINLNAENSDYCNMTVGNKNCYLVFGGDFNEDCMYGTLCMHNRDCMDIDYSNGSELCYMMDNSMDCYGSRFVWDSKNCNNCCFITDCIGCSECILCANLKNKSYFIENRQYSKEEYLKKKKEILTDGYRAQLENWRKFLDLRSRRIVKYAHVISCENCTGDYLKNSKNCKNCYDVSDSEDVRNVIFASKVKDCLNGGPLGDDSELVYDSVAIMGSNAKHSYFVFTGANVEYSEQIINCQDVFGCDGLRYKKYCILNQQYSKKEFDVLRGKIIEHMKRTGEWNRFFPKELSCFAYNESTAMRYYPLTKEQALKEGFKWRDEDRKSFKPQTYVMPDNIFDIQESAVNETLACETCGKNFKIIARELKFYRTQNIPVPRKCADCRQKERISLRTPCKMYDRACAKCGAALRTTYAPDRTEKVYCESCYLKEVY